MIKNDKDLQMLREKYPKGTLIHLIKMDDPFPIIPDSIGTVDHIDDGGTIHMDWFSGSTLGLVEDKDEFEIIDDNFRGILLLKEDGNLYCSKQQGIIPYTLLKSLVGGFIEYVNYGSFSDDSIEMVINEEGKLIPLLPTLVIMDEYHRTVDFLAGPVVFLSNSIEDSIPLTAAQIQTIYCHLERARITHYCGAQADICLLKKERAE